MTVQREMELNLYTIAEDLWSKGQGQISFFSPLDFAYLSAWEDHGIFPEAIWWGISRTFENRARFASQKLTRPVRCVSYCQAEIMEAQRTLSEDAAAGRGEIRLALRRRFLGEEKDHGRISRTL